MATSNPKTLITWDDSTLLADITVEAEIHGVSRSEWIREACRQRLAREDAEEMRVELEISEGAPIRAKIWQGAVLRFNGVDLSATLEKTA